MEKILDRFAVADITIPKRMRGLQRDHRGYPVPFIVLRDGNNKPLFAVNHTGRQNRCVIEKRCPICGNRLDRDIWFVGGPQCAFHPHGAYIDSGMHRDCMVYALEVCPYLAMRPRGKVDIEKLYNRVPKGIVGLQDVTPDNTPPEVFVAVMCREFDWGSGNGTQLLIVRPRRPYLAIEYWRAGKQVDKPPGIDRV